MTNSTSDSTSNPVPPPVDDVSDLELGGRLHPNPSRHPGSGAQTAFPAFTLAVVVFVGMLLATGGLFAHAVLDTFTLFGEPAPPIDLAATKIAGLGAVVSGIAAFWLAGD